MPFRGVRSDTLVKPHSRFFRGIPFNGDRSDTWVNLQFIRDNDMPFRGERSANFPGLPATLRDLSFVNARTGAMFVTWSVENCNSVTTPPSIVCVTLPSK